MDYLNHAFIIWLCFLTSIMLIIKMEYGTSSHKLLISYLIILVVSKIFHNIVKNIET